ncbi:MAG: hypothetical protein HYY22_01235 [Thaumarchaeota archaeon]|nr:hypothetical protein [Nitrososphaerota archaeon]
MGNFINRIATNIEIIKDSNMGAGSKNEERNLHINDVPDIDFDSWLESNGFSKVEQKILRTLINNFRNGSEPYIFSRADFGEFVTEWNLPVDDLQGAIANLKRRKIVYLYPDTTLWMLKLGLKKDCINAFKGQPAAPPTTTKTEAETDPATQPLYMTTTNITLGVTPLMNTAESAAALPHVHYLACTAEVRDVFTGQVISECWDAGCEVDITFGAQRRKISFSVSQNRPGLGYDELAHVLGRIFELIQQKLGRNALYSEFKVVNLHLNTDVPGLRLEGAKAVALDDFNGWFLRLYNKGDSLRVESGVNAKANLMLDRALDALRSPAISEMVAGISTEVRSLRREFKQLCNAVLQDSKRQQDEETSRVK